MSVLERLLELLDRSGVDYRVLRHAAVRTSEEAAQVRGTALASGAKALICKADDRFVLFVMPADLRLDSRAVRKALGARSLRFASGEEVLALTSLKPGAIPPFGQLFDLPTYCDEALAAQPTINFNAGDRSVSVGMTSKDYLAIERPMVARFARPA